MSIVTQLDIVALKDELNNYLRYKFRSYDTQSRITETTQLINGNGTDRTFSLTYGASLSYIAFDGVSVGGTPLLYGLDWLPIFRGANKGKITFTNIPAAGTNNISVKYGYTNTGKSNYCYPDYPRVDLGINQYPRLGFKLFPAIKLLGASGGGFSQVSNILFSLKFVTVNTESIDEAATAVKNIIEKDAKRFYNFAFISPTSFRDFDMYDDTTGKVVAKVIDFNIQNRVEVIQYNT